VKNPTSEEVINRYNQVMVPAVGHYQQISFARGEGSYLWDFEGNKYIDLAGGIATCTIGHCHPEVVREITDQASILTHTSTVGYYKENVEFAELLRSQVPKYMQDGKVIFLNSGSESIEAALKMARMISNRSTVMAFLGGFHGRPMGALAATASSAAYRKGLSGLMVGVVHAVYPYCYRCPLGHRSKKTCGLACADLIRQFIKYTVPASDLAAILLEPLAGEGGYIVPPSEFIKEVRTICDETGALMIVDEIQTGVGRTGKMFCFEHFGVEPDVIVFAKAAGGGMPIGGFIARKEYADQWIPGAHGSTFGGNPVSCRAGKKTLEIILRDKLAERAARLGDYAMAKLSAAKQEIPEIGDVRGLGLMIGIELINRYGSPNPALLKKVLAEAGKRGVILIKAGESVIRLCPALNIPKETLDRSLEIIIETISDMAKNSH